MKAPGREVAIAVVWLAVVGGGFAAFYFLAGPGAKRARAPERKAPPVDEKTPIEDEPAGGATEEPLREPEEPPGEAGEEPLRVPKRVFADSFVGLVPDEWERLGDSESIAVERSGGVLHVKGSSGSLDWDEAGLRTRAYELEGFSVSVGFKLVSNEETGTKMFFLCAEDPENDEAKAWVYFHPTEGGREDPGYAAMKEGGPAKGVGAPDGGKAFHELRLTYARGKLAAFVDERRIEGYDITFDKVRFALGLRSPAEGEEVEGVFDSFSLLDWPERKFEP